MNMIRKMLSLIAVSVFLMLLASAPVSAAGMKCAECGMMVKMDSKFSAKIVQGDTTIPFCDIGDLFVFLNKKSVKNGKAKVRDFTTGAWIDARKAYYVMSNKKFKTPMGWGIAAFKEKSEAAKSGKASDFAGTAKALR
jgi:nitrous oxide reductase accessory protein NosL